MKQVTMNQAKTHLSQLVQDALAGEEVIIARRNTPLVKLSVIHQPHKKSIIGCMPDLVKSMPDDFNASLEDWSDELEPEIPADT